MRQSVGHSKDLGSVPGQRAEWRRRQTAREGSAGGRGKSGKGTLGQRSGQQITDGGSSQGKGLTLILKQRRVKQEVTRYSSEYGLLPKVGRPGGAAQLSR